MITINITGDSAINIRAQMLILLGIDRDGDETHATPDRVRGMDNINVSFDPAHPDRMDFGQIDEPEATQEPVQRDEPEVAPKPKRTRRASVRSPVAETEAIAAPVEAVEEAKPNGHDVAALIATRDRAMTALQAAYAAGKVPQCRALLNQFGEGAKSFRELDLPVFVPIDAAIQAGALA